jgi:hypothetical protein
MATEQQQRSGEEGWTNVGKRARAGGEGDAGVYMKAAHHALTVITENAGLSLVKQGWESDKPCLVTVDTGAYVTMATPDISAGWPERQPNKRFTLETDLESS